MANNDESQQNSSGSARVYKSKDVHRRRGNRKALNDKSASSSSARTEENPRSERNDTGAGNEMAAARARKQKGVLAALSPSEKRKLRQLSDADGAADAGAVGGVAGTDVAARSNVAAAHTARTAHTAGVSPVGAIVDGEAGKVANAGATAEADEGTVAKDADGAEDAAAAVDAETDETIEAAELDEAAEAAGVSETSETEDDAGDTADGQDSPDGPRRPKASLAKRVIGGVVLAILLCAVGVGAYFAWDRWGRYDDHADMQGEWYVAGTTVPLTIDAKSINLTDDISYEYEIDDHGKTIHFSFGPMEGQGRYWFSGDRRFLAITDGEGYNGAGTAFEDVMHAFKDLSSGESITGTHLPEGEGVIVFCREPGKLATMAKEAAERGKERAKKQAEREKEEAERKAAAQEAAEAEAEARAAEAEAAVAGAGAAAAGAVDYYYYDDTAEYADEEGYEGDYADVVYDEVPDETSVETYDEGSGEEYE